jgi:hypothetical protein
MPRLVKLWLWLSALASLAGWLLSAIQQLNIPGYLGFSALTFILAWLYRKHACKPGSPAARTPLNFARLRLRCRRLLPLSFAVFAILIFIGAVLYAPNQHTALSYRLPRVLHWLAEERWHWINTPNFRMNDRACGIEWLTAPVLLFTRSDRALFLLNFIPYLLLPGLIFSVWTRMGVRPRVAWHWMWLMPTGYIFLLQAGSTGNDTFPTVYALAAVDFAFRARESRRLSDLAYSILAGALLTGAKASNIPLLLPWAVLIFLFFAEVRVSRFTVYSSDSFNVLNLFNSFVRGLFAIVREHWLAATAVLFIAAIVSFLPTAILNQRYCHDWSGLNLERTGMNMKSPFVGLWGNALILLFNNFLFTFFPFARWWNAHALTILPHGIVAPLVANFEDGFHIVGEMPTEDYSGIGFGLSVLALASWLGACCMRQKSAPRENQASVPAVGRLLLVAPWISLAAYCMKSGMVTGARLIAPYYPLLFPLWLASPTQSVIVRKRWWKLLAAFVLFLVVTVLVVAPARPLWPARTILSRAVERHPNSSSLGRALSVYTVYSQRSDPLANVRALLPPDTRLVGFMGTQDDIEISLWHPYFSRRVKDVQLSDSAHFIRDQGIKYVVVGGFNLAEKHVSLEEWLDRTHAEVIATTSATVKVSEGPQAWYIARLQD